MDIRRLTAKEELSAYDAWVQGHPMGTLWQSTAWKKYQEALGREVRVYVTQDFGLRTSDDDKESAGALVVIDRTSFGLPTWEIPRGPLTSFELSAMSYQQFLNEIVHEAAKEHCISLFLSPSSKLPPSPQGYGRAGKTQDVKLKVSHRHVHPSATRLIDLTVPEEEILQKMHPKGRYNIRVAGRDGVRTECFTGEDAMEALETVYTLFQETAGRDGFTCHPRTHYKAFLKEPPGSFLFLAYAPRINQKTRNEPTLRQSSGQASQRETPIAALLGVIWGNTGTYYYGASSYAHRSLMAPYLLQWEAMRLCKARGCISYDLLGVVPIEQPETSEQKIHPWSGISDFKAKFGGEVIMYPEEQEIVLRPIAKMFLIWKRKILG